MSTHCFLVRYLKEAHADSGIDRCVCVCVRARARARVWFEYTSHPLTCYSPAPHIASASHTHPTLPEPRRRTVWLACFITERMLQEYHMLKYVPSTIASSAVYLARKNLQRNPWVSDGCTHTDTYTRAPTHMPMRTTHY